MNKISIEEAKKIKLMNRIDKKYIINFEQFCELCEYIVKNFYIVYSGYKYMLDYKSTYFDTIYNSMYNDHENHEKKRQKIRIREYEDGEQFIEIKTKSDEEYTKKIRKHYKGYLDGNKNWILKHLLYDYYSLEKKLEVKFKRITLINFDKNIRVTIDFGIRYNNFITKKIYNEKNIIIEVKKEMQDKTEFEIKLEEFGIQEGKYSKYHTGIKMTKNALNEF